MPSSDITVVKLGGSLAGSGRLGGWLDALAACGGRAVVVPGGGPFADAVREAQVAMGFGDETAHHMALLAMEQYGRALAGLRPGFVVADSREAIRQALRDGVVPIWSPVAMVQSATDIPASWDITSDSLAAWLAGRIGATKLLLVKHGRFADGPMSVADLARRGVVDPAFPQFAAAGVGAFLVSADDPAVVDAATEPGRTAGTPIVLSQAAADRLEVL